MCPSFPRQTVPLATSSRAEGKALCSASLILSDKLSSVSPTNTGTASCTMMAPASTSSCRETARARGKYIYLKKFHLLFQSELFLYVFAWAVFESMQRFSPKRWITSPFRWWRGWISEFVPGPTWKDMRSKSFDQRCSHVADHMTES